MQEKHFYYASIMVGTEPMGAPLCVNEPLNTADRIVQAAQQIRQNLMRQSRSVNYPPVVILNIIPCRDPSASFAA